MIPHGHAVRIARRLARHARKPDRLLRPGMVRRMWAMLEATPGAHAAYRCPPHLALAGHADTLTPGQLDAAADRLEHGAASVPVETPDSPRTLPPGAVDLAHTNP